MESLIMGGIGFVIMISVVVFIHELGHFLTAKYFGVYCGEFSIGMGPVLFKKHGKETQYSIRALPIGGFVSMAGEEDDTKKEVEVPFERTINGIKPYKRIIVMLAGIALNFVLAYFVFVGIIMAQGAIAVPAQPIITSVVEESIAADAGILVNDEVISMQGVDGHTYVIDEFSDIGETIHLYPQMYTYEINRDGEILYIDMEAAQIEDSYVLGIGATQGIKKINWYESFGIAAQQVVDSSTLIFKTLGSLLQGNNLDQLSGPVGIYQMAGDALSSGWISYLSLLAIISINLGVFNALPLPVLDGGRALIVILESITKRKLSERVLTGIMGVSMFLLLGLMLYASWNDILRLF